MAIEEEGSRTELPCMFLCSAVTSVAYFQGMIYSIGVDGKITSLEMSSGSVVDTFEGDDIAHALLISPANGTLHGWKWLGILSYCLCDMLSKMGTSCLCSVV